MKKILLVLTILFMVAAIVSIFIPTNIQAAPGGPEEDPEGPRDPHFHTGEWTTCCNELPRACDSN